MEKLTVFNSLTRQKEVFQALNPPFVGIYVCGPTVYGPPHLGHARSAISFDILFRYLKYSGYKVRYVRNITDVGHLVADADAGEDKIAQKARVEQLEPMEIAQAYTNDYHDKMDRLNLLRPSIEPIASGHIPEQIEMVEKIIENGYGYESNGSIYFDVRAYNEKFSYGKLSGRIIEEMVEGYRDLEGQDEKRFPADFALWKAASPEHIMRWNSPWSIGFPGWHLECTVMSTKYLGTKYDIHGGGMDLLFPHHEAEIAQSNACINDSHSHQLDEARYWMHNNMVTYEGQKMGKSLGNAIGLAEFFNGEHPLLIQAYNPMTIRFFMLQAHYRSTLDFSNDSLQASEKAFTRLNEGFLRLNSLETTGRKVQVEAEKETLLENFEGRAQSFMNDDLNTAKVIALMFEVLPVINEIANSKSAPMPVSHQQWHKFKTIFNTWFLDILGLVPSESSDSGNTKVAGLMDLIISIRKSAREEKNWPLSDKIRDELTALKIQVKDAPEGTEWSINK